MQRSDYDKQTILDDLNEILFISNFLFYSPNKDVDKMKHNKKKLRKKIKKMIKCVEDNEMQKIMSEDWIDENL